jgi:hypothetical protein
MRTKGALNTLTVTSALSCVSQLKAETNLWSFELSLYGVAAGMSGDVTVKGIPAEVDVGFDNVLENLKFGAMGTARVAYDRWSLSTDVIYLSLEASECPATVDVEQWLVQPMLGYRLCRFFELTAGARYNNLATTLEATGPLGNSRSVSDDVGWWDPVIGARASVPIFKTLSFDIIGDLGGFNVGSDLTWQAQPMLNWRFTKWGSLQAGYRWLFTDYSKGSGTSEFRYDILTQGPQLGFTLDF